MVFDSQIIVINSISIDFWSLSFIIVCMFDANVLHTNVWLFGPSPISFQGGSKAKKPASWIGAALMKDNETFWAARPWRWCGEDWLSKGANCRREGSENPDVSVYVTPKWPQWPEIPGFLIVSRCIKYPASGASDIYISSKFFQPPNDNTRRITSSRCGMPHPKTVVVRCVFFRASQQFVLVTAARGSSALMWLFMDFPDFQFPKKPFQTWRNSDLWNTM